MVSIFMTTIQNTIQRLTEQYRLVSIIDLDYWANNDYQANKERLTQDLQKIYQLSYKNNQRIVFTQTHDVMFNGSSVVLSNLLLSLNDVGISSFFIILISTNPEAADQINKLKNLSNDPIAITVLSAAGEFSTNTLEKLPYSKKEIYQYGSVNPIKIDLNELTDREKFLLTESKTFCMYPWIHLHAWPTGQAFPCCMSESSGQIGNCRTQSLSDIWNGPPQRQLRINMLNEVSSKACKRCYEQEESGFFSGRLSANKHHGHLIKRINSTQSDGTVNDFKLTYWDIRFSNLCNLRCRSCGHIFSSQWYQDQSRLAGIEWKKQNKVLNYAGKTELDMWEQLEPHLDYVEQIYFAGGEPLLMEEHYRILDELDRRGLYHVRLIYNTNFTHIDLKGRSVFEYWRKFDSVAVGASLDAAGARAEYIRKGTVWSTVEQNRREMLKVCPEVDFYISPTLSIMNALHLPDFHRDWVAQGLIQPQDLNVNILQDPPHYRIDIAPYVYKKKIQEKFEQHLEWLRPQDQLQRATVGFESAIKFLNATDNSHLYKTFWNKTAELDRIRNERLLDAIPELSEL
jgi:MoaA/NifB/PqqE/SkfB family radical SAM enzyme